MKNYENWSTSAEVIVKIKVAYLFSDARCILPGSAVLTTWQGSRHGHVSHPVVEFLTWPYGHSRVSVQFSRSQRAEQ